GEEKGLLGSKHWLSDPTIPLSRVRLVINMDMVGRLKNNQVEVSGSRSAPGLRRLLSMHNLSSNLVLDFTWNNLDNSDHYPFFERRIPYLMPFTGFHEDYHRPSDDVDKINLPGMQAIARLIFSATHALAESTEIPAFRDAARNESATVQR